MPCSGVCGTQHCVREIHTSRDDAPTCRVYDMEAASRVGDGKGGGRGGEQVGEVCPYRHVEELEGT